MQDWELLLSIVTLLAGAFALGVVFERMRQSALLGYIFAGIVLGPGILNLIPEDDVIQGIANIGITLLLFTIGLDFSARRMLSMGKVALLGGTLQVALTTLVFGGLLVAFGFSLPVAMAIGLILTNSSTASILRILQDRAETESVHGRYTTGLLLVQDLGLIPSVLIIAALSGTGSTWDIAYSVATALILLAVLVAGFEAVSNLILPRLFRAAALVKNRELTALLAVITAFGAAWLTQDLGLSPALGAFIAGMLLAESPFASQMRADIGILRTLFVALFFAAIGMLVDGTWVLQNFGLVLAASAGILVVKAVVVWSILWMLAIPHRYAIATGLVMACAGEFGFVLADLAVGGGLLTPDQMKLIVSSIITTMVATPLMIANADRIGRWIEHILPGAPVRDAGSTLVSRMRDHVVIIGYGPAGRGVVNAVKDTGVQFVILELNPSSVTAAKEDGFEAVLGDASQAEVLENLHVAEARAVVITIPDHNGVLQIIRSITCEAPKTTIVARARYHIHAPSYLEAGAHVVLDEEEHVGVVLGERVMGTMVPRSMSGILEKPDFGDERIHCVE